MSRKADTIAKVAKETSKIVDGKLEQCTAKSKSTGNRCNRRPQPGQSVCYFHGANGGRPIEHGMYSKQLPKDVAEIRTQLLNNEKELLDTKPIIATLKARLDKADKLGINDLADIADKLTKIIERYHKVDIATKQGIPKENVSILINRIIHILTLELGTDQASKVIEKIRSSKNEIIP